MADSCFTKKCNRLIMVCAGAANTGQMTYQLALELMKEGQGNLFCLAGIGAHIKGFVSSARAADQILVLDGCPLSCAAKNLELADIPVKTHFIITELGVKKEHGKTPTVQQMAMIKEMLLKALPPGEMPVFTMVP